MTESQVFTFIVDIAAGAVLGTNVIIFLRLRKLYHQMLESKKALDRTKVIMETVLEQHLNKSGVYP